MRLAFDSTDSLAGGCTTHVALELWRRLAEYEVAHAPRLVRLNPNIPFKTRGNGALCLEIGHGRGRRRLRGVAGGTELWSAESVEEPTAQDARTIFRTAKETISELRAAGSDSGLVRFDDAPPERFYRRCVEGLVPASEAAPVIASASDSAAWGTGRGLLGAAAAAAWEPRRGTFEVIGYRAKERWGTPRTLPPALGDELDRRHPSTFDNWDPRHRHLRIQPRSPCPVLAGIRGTDPAELVRALKRVGPEPPDGWLLFATNQATGDHLRPLALDGVNPFDGAVIEARVDHDPLALPGGHVLAPLRDATGTIDGLAYEPTKEFRDAVRALRAGDLVRVEGSVHASTRSLALEAVTLLESGGTTRVRPLPCPRCGAKTKSKGRRGPMKCPRCSHQSAVQAAPTPDARARGERATVPISVRRHLSRPNEITERRLALSS